MPPYDNRQILEVEFPLEGGSKKHPAVILSVPKVYETEQYYICAMISSIDARDQFSFPLNDDDVTNPFNPDYSQRNLFMNKAKYKIMRKSYVYTMRK